MAAWRSPTIAVFVWCIWGCLPAAAQTDPPLPSRPLTAPAVAVVAEPPTEILRELQRWTAASDEWNAWFARWRNRREPGIWSTRERRQPPVPPAWLPATCTAVLEDTGPWVE